MGLSEESHVIRDGVNDALNWFAIRLSTWSLVEIKALWVGVSSPTKDSSLKGSSREASKFSLQSCVQCSVKAIAATPITKTIYILPCFSVERIYAWHQPRKQGAERGE